MQRLDLRLETQAGAISYADNTDIDSRRCCPHPPLLQNASVQNYLSVLHIMMATL